jgi:hypothetical protein
METTALQGAVIAALSRQTIIPHHQTMIEQVHTAAENGCL